MKVVIMGTGTMACLFASRFAEQSHDVWMVSNWKEQVDAISKNGLALLVNGANEVVFHPHVTMSAEEVIKDKKFPDVVMIWSKGYQTEKTIKNALPIVGKDTRVLTLQNGMGNAEIIAKYIKPENVYFGAASIAADADGYGRVNDTTNKNRSPLIGIVPFTRKDDDFCLVLSSIFNSFGYPTSVGSSYESFVWKKLCLNSCGNALAGIVQLSNDVYSNDQDGFILLNMICRECVAVANAKGIDISFDEMRSYAHITYCKQKHYVSTCQDMHNKRPTEIDTINGAIVRMGKEENIPTPVNETLVHLVKLIQNHYNDQWK